MNDIKIKGQDTDMHTRSAQPGYYYGIIQTFNHLKSPNSLIFRDMNVPSSKDFNVQIINIILEKIGKDIQSVELDDFTRCLNYTFSLSFNKLFEQSFSKAFIHYRSLLEENDYAKYRNERYNDSTYSFLSKEEFILRYGDSSWILINKSLLELEIHYQFTAPPVNIDRFTPFQTQLVDINTGNVVPIDELSSGEKILLSILISIHNLTYGQKKPKLLLIDEPDSNLHPQMVQKLVKILNDIFVKEQRIFVITTTHSPTTIALSPDASIFLMNRTNKRLQKANKDQALRTLLTGIPSLSVSYENRRQVFVEGRDDLMFYEFIYNKVRANLSHDISLNFIQSGFDTTGNCQQVINIVEKLVNCGNKQIYGIIDWDTKNEKFENENIKVLGINQRYNIENYLFDPMLVIALLLREKITKRQELNMNSNETYFELKNFNSERLQFLSDWLLSKVRNKIEISLKFNNYSEEVIRCTYANGSSINIPKWFLFHPGHDLEEYIKISFPELKQFLHRGLKNVILTKVIDDLPELISQDIVDLLSTLQHV